MPAVESGVRRAAQLGTAGGAARDVEVRTSSGVYVPSVLERILGVPQSVLVGVMLC